MFIDLLEHFAFTFTFCLIVKTYRALLLLPLKLQICHTGGHAWILRCATNRNVAGSIPDGIIGIFH